MILEERKLQVFADAFRFDLRDEAYTEDFAKLWTREAMKEMIVVGHLMVGIMTIRNTIVPVTIRHLDSYPNKVVQSEWDQIVECSINIRSGALVVFGNEYFPEAPRINLDPGKYGLQICWGNLDSISSDGLEGDDRYQVSLWKSDEPLDIRFVKRQTT